MMIDLTSAVAICTLVTAFCCMIASVHAQNKFDRHLFAWVSAAFMLKVAFLMSGYLNDSLERVAWDLFMGLLFISFSLINALRLSRILLP